MKAIIFDLDGVIVSTDTLHFQSWMHVAMLEQLTFNEAINHELRGISRLESLEVILSYNQKTYDHLEKQRLLDIKNTFYVDLLKDISPKDIKEGIMDILDMCDRKGILVAIGSSSKNAIPILEQLKLKNRFHAVVTGHDTQFSKPDPEVFLLASKRLNLNPEACIVIEDAHAGIKAAKKAHMRAFAVGDAISSTLKDGVISDVIEMLKKIEDLHTSS
jgi:beta-phosphoglucomutase